MELAMDSTLASSTNTSSSALIVSYFSIYSDLVSGPITGGSPKVDSNGALSSS